MDALKLFSQRGFNLVEVVMAVALFGGFVLAYVASQSSAVENSIAMDQELTLNGLATLKMNELIVAPPPYGDGLTRTTIADNFEGDFKDYRFEINYYRLEVPDFAKLFALAGQSGQGSNGSATDQFFERQRNNQNQNQGAQQIIFQQLKENIEQIVWQLEVIVIHVPSDQRTVLKTWVTNPNAAVQMQLGL